VFNNPWLSTPDDRRCPAGSNAPPKREVSRLVAGIDGEIATLASNPRWAADALERSRAGVMIYARAEMCARAGPVSRPECISMLLKNRPAFGDFGAS
jgi:hypothetical protein